MSLIKIICIVGQVRRSLLFLSITVPSLVFWFALDFSRFSPWGSEVTESFRSEVWAQIVDPEETLFAGRGAPLTDGLIGFEDALDLVSSAR